MALDETDWRTTFEFQAAGGLTAVNVIGIRSEAGVAATDVALAVRAALNTEMFSGMVTSSSIVNVKVQNYAAVPAFGESGTTLITGETGGQAIPQVAIVTSFGTGLAGRSNRGRSFCPFIGEGAQDGGLISSVLATAMENAWADFAAALLAGDPELAHTVISETTDDSHQVSTYNTHLTVGTQRRRQQRQYV